MKYFYTDELLAALVKRCFGVDFISPHSDLGKSMGYNFVDNFRYVDRNYETVCWRSLNGKIYLNPESQNILEGQTPEKKNALKELNMWPECDECA